MRVHIQIRGVQIQICKNNVIIAKEISNNYLNFTNRSI